MVNLIRASTMQNIKSVILLESFKNKIPGTAHKIFNQRQTHDPFEALRVTNSFCLTDKI